MHGIQRSDESWSRDYYKKVIDSIFRNMLIPMFVVSQRIEDFVDEDGKVTIDMARYVLDGGHRTLAIKNFLNNEFKVKITTNSEEIYFNELSKLQKTGSETRV